jgi:hypothetical protein
MVEISLFPLMAVVLIMFFQKLEAVLVSKTEYCETVAIGSPQNDG